MGRWWGGRLTDYSESSDPPQGTGSITVLDSHFNRVPYAITVAHQEHQYPSIVLDNLLVENSESVVLISGGEALLPGSGGPLWFNSWMSGYQVLPDGYSGRRTGFIGAKPNKPTALPGGQGGYFYRSKPQYGSGGLVVATEHGISNDATGDQTNAINALLRGNVGSTIFFPGGVYLVKGTVEIPAMARVGQPGDSGVIEISDMLFTTKEGTAGCILMEWNVHESHQGSAAIWDSHFRSLFTSVAAFLSSRMAPTWFWGGGSEHAQLYQWQLLGASNIVMGHVQTEAPYYQDNPTALEPYTVAEWPADPGFEDCAEDFCKKAWALRILNSSDVFLYGLGLYSFSQDNNLGCALSEECPTVFH
ncbi:hypothetical protein DL766_008242 [Monosporascus sp. MC13-8B]|uniref:Rhamnogalacturonase A/B/Epimerase-like pectate lyase domain-containing protein n=1 Tax=Monosporascus cannonballus TaxID=155416 RepID=A0ABY0H2F2_9PEZI|nr:hypothetical protein DL762_006475 [Monosporascus cannonballus]RYO99633.1 hypothetical protein DL763_001347 [Monosporascus cannonballus]RYP20206.1 hypothetical protein DL766_008242 [Monosporascus sp. MC13-8B]